LFYIQKYPFFTQQKAGGTFIAMVNYWSPRTCYLFSVYVILVPSIIISFSLAMALIIASS